MRLNKVTSVCAVVLGLFTVGIFSTSSFAVETDSFHWPNWHWHWPHWPHHPNPAPAPAPVPPALPMQQKEWTFLIYLNGNNSLDSFGSFNIEQMEKVGSNDKINVVVQWASASDTAHTKRLYIEKSADGTKVTSPVVQDAGDVDMGDYKSFVSFVQWGVQNFPAQHYFLDIWNHGNGWESDSPGSRANLAGNLNNPLDLSWDDHTGHHITNTQMGQALSEAAQAIGHKIDVYGSDACMMAMAEVATEVADSVNIFVGSEETEPGAGWPYDAILNQWNALSDASPEAVAKVVTTEYTKSYMPGGENTAAEVTFSAFDMSKVAALDTTLALFADNLAKLDAQSKKAAVAAASNAIHFEISDYKDIQDFLHGLEGRGTGADAQAIAAVKAAAQDLVIAVSSTKTLQGAGGVSLWIPTDADTYNSWAHDYSLTKFEGLTHWSETLKSLLQ